MAGLTWFLKIDGVPGGSTDPTHLNWIEIASLQWGGSTVPNDLRGRGAGRGAVGSEPGDYRIFLTPRDPEVVPKLQHRDRINGGDWTARLETLDPERGLVARCDFTGMGIHDIRAVHGPDGVQLQVEFYYQLMTPGFGSPPAASARTGQAVLAHEALHSKPIPSNHNETLVRDR